jgi:hypothetical protein
MEGIQVLHLSSTGVGARRQESCAACMAQHEIMAAPSTILPERALLSEDTTFTWLGP